MSGVLTVKNWAKFQHYRDRCPPWIKLHADTFQNPDFACLSSASKLLAICIWTLASRSSDGIVPDDFGYIRQWGFLGDDITKRHLDELINSGLVHRASKRLAKRKQVAMERRGEESRDREEETSNSIESIETLFQSETTSAERLEIAPAPVAIALPLVDKSDFPITEIQAAELQRDFPAVNVPQQLREMHSWCLANPTRRKTKTGVMRFVHAWLAKEQNRGGRNGQSRKPDQIEAIRNSTRRPDFGRGNV